MTIKNNIFTRKAETLEEVRKVCRPMPLKGEQLSHFFVETDSARKQQQGEKSPPKADAVNQILLKSCALVEYNGEGWLGVHPLVIENLKALGRL